MDKNKQDTFGQAPSDEQFEKDAEIIEETLESQTKPQGEAQQIEFEKPQVVAQPAAGTRKEQAAKYQLRRIPVPPHRMTPLRSSWEKIVTTVVENMRLQIRMNTKRKTVEIKTSDHTEDKMALQRTADFLKAFMLGFDLNDAIAMLRLDDLYIESFEIKDVKMLHGDHLSRCIGRISGEKGKTKYAIENSTRTRIVIADTKIHILGSYSNIRCARDAVCSLILGSPPGKVYSQLRYISKRYTEKF